MNKWKIVVAVALASLLVAWNGVSYGQSKPADNGPVIRPAQPGVSGAADNTAAGGVKPQPASQEGDKGQPPSNSPFDFKMIAILMGAIILMWWFSTRSRKKQESKRKEMLAALKKGDKVTSIGGIIGTVIEAREDEITVKVDETNNVRVRFARWAIRGVGEDAKTEKPEDKK